MDAGMLGMAGDALLIMLDPTRLAILTAAVLIGLAIGVIPGLGGIVGMALLIPFTYTMDPYAAFAFLLGMAAFNAAKARSVARALEATASRFPIPWIAHHAERAAAAFGELFPYGIEANRTTLETFLRFAHEQGVCHKSLAPEDLFPETVHSAFKV